MVLLNRSPFSVSLLCVLLYVSVEQVRALRCYICHTDDNESCQAQLRDCPSDQAYDRCMTTIYKNPLDGLHIKKECALAPCHLRGNVPNFANFKSNCESSNQDCTFCCTGDGCNKDSAPGRAPISVHHLCLISFAIYVLRQFFIE